MPCMMMRAILMMALVEASGAWWIGLEPWEDDIMVSSTGAGKVSTGIGKLGDGNRIWGDLKDARFTEVPAWMRGINLAVPGYKVSRNMKLFWDCPHYIANANPPMNPNGCMCYIFQYKCSGCAHEEGGLGQLLEKQGRTWEKFFCAPKFKIEDDDDKTDLEAHHPMIAYRTWAKSGERVEVILTAPVTEFVLIGGDDREQLRTCITHGSSNCEDKLGQCEWDAANGECINRTCRSPFTGPTVGLGKGTCAARCVAADIPHKKP